MSVEVFGTWEEKIASLDFDDEDLDRIPEISKRQIDIDFLQCASVGHLAALKNCLENGADLKARGEKGNSCLHLAVMNDRVEVLAFLVSLPTIDVDMYDEEEVCPLLIACEKGLTEAARILLEAGANPNNGDKEDQFRPITAAVSRGYIDIVRLLIDHGLNVNNPARRGTTGLHTAVTVGNLEAVKLLMKGGADPTEQDSRRNSALINACYCRELNAAAIVRYLLENYPDRKRLLDIPGNKGFTAVHVCTRLSRFEELQVLFEFGADADALDLDDELPLNHAISNRDKRFVETLLPHTSLAVLNDCRIDPVAQAVDLADLELFQLLMERGLASDRVTYLPTDWEELDEDVWLEDCLFEPELGTPLTIAVMHGAHDIALDLVARGSRLHFACGTVLSPLLVALFRRKESDRYDLLLQRMLERGQETLSLNQIVPGTPFPSIPTCWVILVSHGYSTEVLRWLLKKGMNPCLENWAIVPVSSPETGVAPCSFEETVSRRLSQTQRNECLMLMAQFTKSTSPSYAWLLRNISPEVTDILTTPRSLQQLCRFTVRESVEKSEALQTSDWASDLGLPDKLQKYVLFEDGD